MGSSMKYCNFGFKIDIDLGAHYHKEYTVVNNTVFSLAPTTALVVPSHHVPTTSSNVISPSSFVAYRFCAYDFCCHTKPPQCCAISLERVKPAAVGIPEVWGSDRPSTSVVACSH